MAPLSAREETDAQIAYVTTMPQPRATTSQLFLQGACVLGEVHITSSLDGRKRNDDDNDGSRRY